MSEPIPPGQTNPVEVPPSRVFRKLRWRPAGEIVPDFWEPGLIDGVLETHGMTVVYGRSGCGKTAVVVDMACRIAAKRLWRSREVQPGRVVYCAVENPQSTERRIWAWCQRERLDPAQVPLDVIESALTINQESVKDICDFVKERQEECGEECRMIVLDTLARTYAGDENDTADMNTYVRWVDQLRDVSGAHVVIIHHTGKDESRGARGSSALKAATDHELEVFKEPATMHGGIKLCKVREGDLEGHVFGFILEKVELGENRLRRKVYTVVATETDKAPEKQTAPEHIKVIHATLNGLGGRATEAELRRAVGDISTGKKASEDKAWGRLFKAGHLWRDQDGYVRVGEDKGVMDLGVFT